MADIREKQLQRREGLCQLIGSQLLADTNVTLLPWASGEVKPHGRERVVGEGCPFHCGWKTERQGVAKNKVCLSPFPLISCFLLVSQQRHPIMNLSRDPSVN